MTEEEQLVGIPYHYWGYEGDQFKRYVKAYLNKWHPGLTPVRVRSLRGVICTKKIERAHFSE